MNRMQYLQQNLICRGASFVASFVILWMSSAAVATDVKNSDKSRPSIIVILADDLGYGDTSVYGGWVHTPNLERLAKEGLKFTDFHANSSVCSPTRAAFLTGRYQQRAGIIDVLARHLETPPLDPSEITIAKVLKSVGYQTALYGKWHLGKRLANNPTHHGFDDFRGYLDGYVDYHAHAREWYHNLKVEPQKGYSTHLITKNAVDFIRRQADSPYFLYVAHEAVHLPFQTPADTPENRKPIPKDQRWNPKRIRPKYKVMLEEMDKGIGEILAAVNESEHARNTLVFFFSDNGAIGAGSNQPFRGGKFSHYEGGHRVPAIAWWPGQIAPGSTSDQLTAAMDLLPTFARISGAKLPARKLDGIDISPLMLNGQALPKRKMFFGYEPKLGTALRDDHWKMIVKKDKVQLFDLSSDIGERKNVAEQYPDRATRMRAEIESWKKQVTWERPAESLKAGAQQAPR